MGKKKDLRKKLKKASRLPIAPAPTHPEAVPGKAKFIRESAYEGNTKVMPGSAMYPVTSPAADGQSSIRGIPAQPPPTPAVPVEGESMFQPLVGSATGYLSYGAAWDPNLTENPDEVMLSRYGAYTYQEMVKNPHVSAAVTRALGEALTEKYDVQAYSEEDEDVEVAEFLRYVIDPDSPWFITKLWQMCDSFSLGHSITEKIWGVLTSGPFQGHWSIVDFKTKDPKQYRVLLDQFRNVIGYRDRWASADTPFYPKWVAILMTWMERYGNKFGTAQLQAARAPYEFLIFITKSRMKYLETFGKPSRAGKYTGKSETIRQAYFDALKKWGDEFCMVHGPDFEFDIVQAVSDAGSHDSASTWAANEVAIAILGAADTGKQILSGKPSTDAAAKRASLLSDLVWNMVITTLNDQVVKELVYYNYPLAYARGALPRILRLHDESMTYEEANALAVQKGIWADACEKRGIKISKADWQEKFAIPACKEGEEEVDVPAAMPSPFGGGGGKDGEDQPHPGAGPVQNPSGVQEPGGDNAGNEDDDQEDTSKMADRTRVPITTPRHADQIFIRLMRLAAESEATAQASVARESRTFRTKAGADLKKKARARSWPFRAST